MREHPIDCEGMPLIPPEFIDFDGPEDTHHLFYPRCDYKGIIEQRFRNLLTIEIPRIGHVALHKELAPPPKPPIEFMAGYVQASGLHIPRRLITAIRRGKYGA